jgi:hypothetical protein
MDLQEVQRLTSEDARKRNLNNRLDDIGWGLLLIVTGKTAAVSASFHSYGCEHHREVAGSTEASAGLVGRVCAHIASERRHT